MLIASTKLLISSPRIYNVCHIMPPMCVPKTSLLEAKNQDAYYGLGKYISGLFKLKFFPSFCKSLKLVDVINISYSNNWFCATWLRLIMLLFYLSLKLIKMLIISTFYLLKC